MRVAVTTVETSAGRWTRQLESRHFEAVILPCIDVLPGETGEVARMRAIAEEADAIVVTSARVIAALWPQGGIPQVEVYVVGAASAQAVEAAGGRVTVQGGGGVVELLDRLHVAGKTVAFPHGDLSEVSVTERLSGGGAIVLEGVVYRTVPRGPDLTPVEAAVFASPSAVRGWCLTRGLDGIITAAIGDSTASAIARECGQVDVIAPKPNVSALVSALAERMRP